MTIVTMPEGAYVGHLGGDASYSAFSDFGDAHDDPPRSHVLRTWPRLHDLPTVRADLLDALNARIPDRDFKVAPPT